MKWKTKLAAFALLACLACSTSAVLAADGPSEAPVKAKIETLYDFETQFEINNLFTRYSIGKTLVSDQHVTSGKGSMYVEVDGMFPEYSLNHIFGEGYEHLSTQYIKFWGTKNPYFAITDFSDVSNILLDVYNDSDRDTAVEMYLQTTCHGGGDTYTRIGRKVLLKGKQTTLNFEFKDDLIYKGVENTTAVYLLFDNKQVGQAPVKLYFDYMRAVKMEKPYEKKALAPTGDVLCGFEDELSAKMIPAVIYNCPVDYLYEFELNDDKTFVSEGERSLKITLPGSNYFREWQWGGFYIATMYSEDYFGGVTARDFASDDYLYFDVYNATNEWFVGEVLAGGLYKMAIWPTPGKWDTIKVPLSELQGSDKALDLSLSFFEYDSAKDRVLYLDNIRIGKEVQA